MAVGHSASATTEDIDETMIWGNALLPMVVEAIGGFERKVYGVRLHAEYGRLTRATIMYDCGAEIVRDLKHYGTMWLSGVLNLPRGVQAITVNIEADMYVIVHCRFAPIGVSADSFTAALKEIKDEVSDGSRT